MSTSLKSSSFHKILILVFGIAFGLVALALIYKGAKTSNDIRSRAAGVQEITYKSWEFNGTTTEGWTLVNLTGLKVANGYLTGVVPVTSMGSNNINVTLSNKSVATAMPTGNKYLKFRLGVFNPPQYLPTSPQSPFTIVVSYMTHGALQQKELPAIPGTAYGNLYEYSVRLPDIGGITIDSIQMTLKPMRAGMSIQLDWVRLTGPPPPTPTPTPTGVSQPTPTSRPSPVKNNPFGIFINFNIYKAPVSGIGIAKTLGASYYRTHVTLTENLESKETLAAVNSGLKSILTIRYNGGRRNGIDYPTTPPFDFDFLRTAISGVIDKYHPTVLIYENEENLSNSFAGTKPEYLAGLKVVCEVAHEKGIKCANGGISAGASVLVTAYHYEVEQPDPAKFTIVTDNTLGSGLNKIFEDGGRTTSNKTIQNKYIKPVKELIYYYKSSGADYMNFHWYSQNTQALQLVAAFLKNESGLPLITNEFGQRTTDTPEGLSQVMQTIDNLQIPIAVEFCFDDPAFNDKALVNPDGTLRPDGEAFQQFISQRYR
jgi:hypothetical protein